VIDRLGITTAHTCQSCVHAGFELWLHDVGSFFTVMTTNLDCQFSCRVTRSPSREGRQPLDDFAMLSRTGELSGVVHAIRSEVESNGFH
jgi:hypothetical protein